MSKSIIAMCCRAVIALACAPRVMSQEAASRPTTVATRPTTSQPATSPAISPEAMKILQELEAAGKKHATVRCEVDYRVDSRLTGDTELRTGYVAYRKESKKTPSKFRIHFETLKLGESKRTKNRVDYAFDGQWLSVAKHEIRQLTRYQVAAPGERVQPLRLGKGPFPLPFGQKVADVIEFFDVKTRKPAKTDPPNTDYLKLTTKPMMRKKTGFRYMEMWVDCKTRLPAKLITRDKSRNKTTVTFSKVQAGIKIDDKEFIMPRKRGWKPPIIRPLEKAEKLTP